MSGRPVNISPHKEQIILQASKYFSQLVSDIDNARHSVALETYIITTDQTALSVLDALKRAALRGVKTRLMVDGIGSSTWLTPRFRELQKSGVKVKVYHPLPWRFWEWKMSVISSGVYSKLLSLFRLINRRNHRKVCIIDEQIVWVGSFNITSVHLPLDSGGSGWRDTAIRVITSDQAPLKAFNKTWFNRRRFARPDFSEPGAFLINDTLLKRRNIHRNLLRKIRHCKHSCWITNPYFIPDRRLLARLRKAAQRGVDVRILVPARSDVFFIPWASSVLYPPLLKAGVHIHEYEAGILHAKTVIIDDWASIGSSNMNTRSVLHDLEIDYTLQQPENSELLKQQFLEDLENSTEIYPEDLQKRNMITKILGRAVLFLRYWL